MEDQEIEEIMKPYTRHFDDTYNRYYYFDTSTSKSLWELPRDIVEKINIFKQQKAKKSQEQRRNDSPRKEKSQSGAKIPPAIISSFKEQKKCKESGQMELSKHNKMIEIISIDSSDDENIEPKNSEQNTNIPNPKDHSEFKIYDNINQCENQLKMKIEEECVKPQEYKMATIISSRSSSEDREKSSSKSKNREESSSKSISMKIKKEIISSRSSSSSSSSRSLSSSSSSSSSSYSQSHQQSSSYSRSSVSRSNSRLSSPIKNIESKQSEQIMEIDDEADLIQDPIRRQRFLYQRVINDPAENQKRIEEEIIALKQLSQTKTDQSDIPNMDKFLSVTDKDTLNRRGEQDIAKVTARPSRKQTGFTSINSQDDQDGQIFNIISSSSTHKAKESSKYKKSGNEDDNDHDKDADKTENHKNWDVISQTRCDSQLDSGFTRAELSDRFNSNFCHPWAKGCCLNGQKCRYYHRVPCYGECLAVSGDKDVFGRARKEKHREDRGGVGSFNLDTSSIEIKYVKCANDGINELTQVYRILFQNFSEWGDIEDIRYYPNQAKAVVKYRHRCMAEFAKEAMQNQSLNGSKDFVKIIWFLGVVEDEKVAKYKQQHQKKLKRIIDNLKLDYQLRTRIEYTTYKRALKYNKRQQFFVAQRLLSEANIEKSKFAFENMLYQNINKPKDLNVITEPNKNHSDSDKDDESSSDSSSGRSSSPDSEKEEQKKKENLQFQPVKKGEFTEGQIRQENPPTLISLKESTTLLSTNQNQYNQAVSEYLQAKQNKARQHASNQNKQVSQHLSQVIANQQHVQNAHISQNENVNPSVPDECEQIEQENQNQSKPINEPMNIEDPYPNREKQNNDQGNEQQNEQNFVHEEQKEIAPTPVNPIEFLFQYHNLYETKQANNQRIESPENSKLMDPMPPVPDQNESKVNSNMNSLQSNEVQDQLNPENESKNADLDKKKKKDKKEKRSHSQKVQRKIEKQKKKEGKLSRQKKDSIDVKGTLPTLNFQQQQALSNQQNQTIVPHIAQPDSFKPPQIPMYIPSSQTPDLSTNASSFNSTDYHQFSQSQFYYYQQQLQQQQQQQLGAQYQYYYGGYYPQQ